LDNHYLAADKAEQLAFQQLLALEDIELMRYLMADQQPDDQSLSVLISHLRVDG
jgi:antitoxin CptB